MKPLLVSLLRGGEAWEFSFQDFSYNWKRTPPEPRSGLVVRFGS